MPRFDDRDYQNAITICDRVTPYFDGKSHYTYDGYSYRLHRQARHHLLEAWRGNTLLMRFEWSDDDGYKELKQFKKPDTWVDALLQFGLP